MKNIEKSFHYRIYWRKMIYGNIYANMIERKAYE